MSGDRLAPAAPDGTVSALPWLVRVLVAVTEIEIATNESRRIGTGDRADIAHHLRLLRRAIDQGDGAEAARLSTSLLHRCRLLRRETGVEE